jgi:hypothetical protein
LYMRAASLTPSGTVSLTFLGLDHAITRGGVRFSRLCRRSKHRHSMRCH